MPRPIREAPSPSALPPALLRLLVERGLSPADVARVGERGGVAPEAIEHDDVAITATSLASMLDAGCEALADPHLPLRLPSELRYRRYDALTLAARASTSPRAVLELMVRYGPLVFPSLACGIEAASREVRFSMRFTNQPRGLGASVDQYLLATSFALATRAHAVAVRPLRFWLASPRPRRLEPLTDGLGIDEIDFGMETTGFALATQDADRDLPGADPMLVATAEELASAALRAVPRRGAFGEAVGAAIEKSVGNGTSPSVEDIATAMHMSTRTLQRRLDDEGLRFSEVLDRVREQKARALLRDEAVALGEVAYRTGFSDLATFSRAFKRWSGLPPGAFRARRRSEGGRS
jgi:AraC-like DNA-binding protein